MGIKVDELRIEYKFDMETHGEIPSLKELGEIASRYGGNITEYEKPCARNLFDRIVEVFECAGPTENADTRVISNFDDESLARSFRADLRKHLRKKDVGLVEIADVFSYI